LPEMPRESIYLNGYDRSPNLNSVINFLNSQIDQDIIEFDELLQLFPVHDQWTEDQCSMYKISLKSSL